MYNYNYDTWYHNMMRNFNSNNNMTGSFLFTIFWYTKIDK